MTVADRSVTKVPTWCYQCVAGPDLLTVTVEDGVATEVEPNFGAADMHPGGGKVCVKAYGLIQKTYNPHRILTPMRRTNPKKGRHEDPGFVPISWDEALDDIATRLLDIRQRGLLDESGYPRVAASFGGGGTPQSYMGTLPAFLAAWGPIDFGIGSGQGVKCYHSEHLYGELWHRAFVVTPDTPRTRYLVSFGSNIEASGGVAGVWRHAEARERGLKRVQVEPHLSVTGACSAEWVPIRPKTDAAFMFAMIHVLLHEADRTRLDLDFLAVRTAAPYLVGPNGYYLRDPDSKKPLVWDTETESARPFDDTAAQPALSGHYQVDAIEVGPDEAIWRHDAAIARPAFDILAEHAAPWTPEWAAAICDVSAASVRRVAADYLDNACVGETIEIDGHELPFRPVAITLGKTVNNGWGGYECCWARTLLACMVGALEVPGGTLGTTIRLNRPMSDRLESVRSGADGFMDFPFNPTDRDHWQGRPNVRNAYRTLVPLAANSPWSQALGPTHLAWMFLDDPPENLPPATYPELWFVYRTNPAISNWDGPGLVDKMARFPFVVAFAYTDDETNHMADILLPERTDLESDQLIRIGATKYVEQFWDCQGYALRQAAVAGRGDTRDMTDIATELARRTGLLADYNAAINKGTAGVALSGDGYDYSLDPDTAYPAETIWDRSCLAASAELGGGDGEGLDWFREHGYRVVPFSELNWYLYPSMVEKGLRFELPYQERLLRIGRELANRLHDHGIEWWDAQLDEYSALPAWKDFPGLWMKEAGDADGDVADYPFWLLTARSMQYAWGGNAGIQLMNEVAGNVAGHGGVVINAGRAAELGIADDDMVEVRSALRATRGRAILRQGIRPDTLLMIGQFDHWKTPFAKDLATPSLNTVAPMSMGLTDATGSGADLVRVAVEPLGTRR
ncbi:MAG: molybdopterin-dependent oxidoreductase [Alphaproteobacteria bacterium]|nr:molybdopterin-dependent oxidoreductase [Alphaproteobacteria bacterium]